MYLSLGSNLEPQRHLAWALAELRRAFTVTGVSAVYLTAPVGDSDQPDFWNLAVAIDTDLEPTDVGRLLREIESGAGRERDPLRRNGPRTLDVDLVLVAGRHGEVDGHVLPSPQVAQDAFVAVPLADLDPYLLHPLLGERVKDIAARLVAGSIRPPQRLEVLL